MTPSRQRAFRLPAFLALALYLLLPLSASADAPSFTGHVITTSADALRSVYAADVDGDGDMDILSAAAGDDKVAWYENDGSESFTEHVISTAADGVRSVYAADMDGDGDMDILSASQLDNKIAWYENDGSEGFTEHALSTSANGAMSVYAADLDGDGDMDALSASYHNNKIAWYENDGSASFTEHAVSMSASGAYSVYTADVDDDGDMDVLSASYSDNKIAWHENDGSESFTSHTVANSAGGAVWVHAADVDGDGDVDMLSASVNDDKIAWYENDGSESFTTRNISTSADQATTVHVADLDGDGDMDVLSASQRDDKFAWFENDGSEGFTEHTISTSADGAHSIHAVDLDGDGDMDVLSGSHLDDAIAWYENDTVSTFEPTSGLVAWYPFDGNASDMSGNGNHGTPQNGTSLGTDRHGRSGKAYNFDGVNGLIDYNASEELLSNFSLSFWAYPESSMQVPSQASSGSVIGFSPKILFAPAYGGGSGAAGLGISLGSNGIYTISHSTGNYSPILVHSATLSSWNHFVIKVISNQPSLFINSSFIRQGLDPNKALFFSKTINGTILNGEIGKGYYGAFKGSIDEVRLYDRALSAAEVAALYQLENTPPPNQPPAFAESNATFTVAENNASASFVLNATDPDANTTLVYSASGPDAGKFTLNVVTGTLTFTNTPDYEANASAAGNNAYSLTITVTDGEANATQSVTVNVTDDPADNPLDLTTGLVAYYPFDGNASDMSGNGHHGTVNGATLGLDRHGSTGNAYVFNDASDIIIVPTVTSANSGKLTISVWVQAQQILHTAYPQILNFDGVMPISGLGTAYNQTFKGKFQSYIEPTDVNSRFAEIYSPDPLPLNIWQHIAVNSNGLRSKMFLNGTLIGDNASETKQLMFAKLTIGNTENQSNHYWNGSIDDVRIYDRALSAAEVTALYQFENTSPNQPPAFAESNATFTTVENNASASFVVTATDPDANATLVYAKSGPDADKFTLNVATGTLTCVNTPDFEANASAAGNNAYSLTITVTDGEANATQSVTINVTNMVEDFDGDGIEDHFDSDDDDDGFSDTAETAYGSDPRNPASVANQAPTALDLNNSTIAENQPAGTIVGKLTGVDPDGNSTLAFSRANGQGSKHNNQFFVGPHNNLKAKNPIDFESNATLTVRLKVRDEHNASYEKIFQISVLNVVEDLDGDGIEDHADPDDDGDGFSDTEELAAGTNPDDNSSIPNRTPTNIILATNFIQENRPAGTVVGTLSAVDPDVGASHAYSFAGMNASIVTHNPLVAYGIDAVVEVNGTLWKALVNLSPQGIHKPATNYALGNRVSNGQGQYYEAKMDFQNAPVWASHSWYEASTIVSYQGNFYLSKSYHKTKTPTTRPDYWGLVDLTLVGTAWENVTANAMPGGSFWSSFDPPYKNHLFTLDANGTLKTAAILDHEANATRTVRVRATDEHNASIEQTFVITVLDDPADNNTSTVGANGTIPDQNGTFVDSNGTYVDENATVLDGNGTFVDTNATVPDQNGTHVDDNATIPDANATGVDTNGTLVDDNATVLDGNGTFVDTNATFPDQNGTHVDDNATIPDANATVVDTNGTFVDDIATLPDVNATLPDNNSTVPDPNTTPPDQNETIVEPHEPHPDGNGTIPDQNGTFVDHNETHVDTNVTIPDANTTIPDANATMPDANVTVPDPNTTPPDQNETILEPHEPHTDGNGTVPDQNGTFVDHNQTHVDTNGTHVDGNATLPDSNATVPDPNTTPPDQNGTLVEPHEPHTDANGTVPDQNSTFVDHNQTHVDANASSPDNNATLPDSNTAVPDPDTTPPDQHETIVEPHEPHTDGNGTVSDQNGTLVDHNQTYVDANGTAPDANTTVLENNATIPDANEMIVDNNETIVPPPPATYRPIARTLRAETEAEGRLKLNGAVLTDGGATVTEVGFILSNSLFGELHSPGAIIVGGTLSGDVFTASSAMPDLGKRFYYRAYATNAKGTNFGSPKRFVVPESVVPSAWWASAEEATAGWRVSSWFGAFRPYGNGWIFHADLGWLYVQPDGVDGLWVWSEGQGWLWTNPGSYRYLYEADTHQWLYFLKRKNGQPRFYNHATRAVE